LKETKNQVVDFEIHKNIVNKLKAEIAILKTTLTKIETITYDIFLARKTNSGFTLKEILKRAKAELKNFEEKDEKK